MHFEPYPETLDYEARLTQLTQRHRLAFSLWVCERLWGNYDRFHVDTGWGDPTLNMKAIALAWGCIGGEVDPSEVTKLSPQAEANQPDEEEFGSVLCSLALDASTAFCHLINQARTSLSPTREPGGPQD